MFVSVSAVLCLIFCCIVFHLYLQLVFQSVLRAIVRLWVLWSIWWPTFICEWWFVAVLMLCTEKLIKHTVKVETLTRWVLLRQNLSSSQYSTTLNSFHVWISRFFWPSVCLWDHWEMCWKSKSSCNIRHQTSSTHHPKVSLPQSPISAEHFATCNQVWRNHRCLVFFHVCMSAFACSRVVGL